ncbi:DUF3105 domain-containing protein [Actinoplanes couchii]|uniref:DUF3105 domain-containing protein n=1 Tax=Actinoplanes couchii TaxID=403638 RepID=A0ABQ3X5Y0_9ACTN|nr:DUF3105 domain-containing protein [Actinoplanes couchii]MDR6325377.1 hypothetical protein [Actinoplanes couchii]GID53920.1 hypothetical protein Aco03nite_023240 [Actinoplanes couchii]
MSMSTPGPERVPSTVKVDKTTGQGKPPAGKPSGGRPGGPNRPGGKGGKKGRKPVTPVKVAGGRNWGPIAVAGVVVLIAVGIIGWSVAASVQSDKKAGIPWEERASAIADIVNFRETDPDLVKGSQHKNGALTYAQDPPVAGEHNPSWQNCNGIVYDAPIAKEHAVHSLEHGAVWVAYKEGLPADQVAKLAAKVEGREKTLMSPYPGLTNTVSLQAWGYQLKLDSVDDPRIDEFIKALRVNASIEGPTALCDSGVSATGTAPQS